MERLRSKRTSSLLAMVGVGLLVLVLDQLAKAWIVSNMVSHDMRVIINGFLRLRYTENSGSAFGLFQGWTGLLSIAALVIICAIVISAFRMGNGSTFMAVCLGMILGGAVGNLADRIRLGYVVDFIEVYGPRINWQGTTYTWPVFNVADSAISVGVVLIMGILLFSKPEETAARKETTQEGTPTNPGNSSNSGNPPAALHRVEE